MKRISPPHDRRTLQAVIFDPERHVLSLGNESASIKPPPYDNRKVLESYLELVTKCRGARPDAIGFVRESDIDALSVTLDLDADGLRDLITSVLGATPAEATHLLQRLRRRKAMLAIAAITASGLTMASGYLAAADSTDSPAPVVVEAEVTSTPTTFVIDVQPAEPTTTTEASVVAPPVAAVEEKVVADAPDQATDAPPTSVVETQVSEVPDGFTAVGENSEGDTIYENSGGAGLIDAISEDRDIADAPGAIKGNRVAPGPGTVTDSEDPVDFTAVGESPSGATIDENSDDSGLIDALSEDRDIAETHVDGALVTSAPTA